MYTERCRRQQNGANKTEKGTDAVQHVIHKTLQQMTDTRAKLHETATGTDLGMDIHASSPRLPSYYHFNVSLLLRFKTRSTGTVDTSTKARLTSVAISVPPTAESVRDRHRNLIIIFVHRPIANLP